MSSPKRKKVKEEEKTETTKESMETTMISKVDSFSYTVARTLTRKCFNFVWNIIEKGYNKSATGQEYEISYFTIQQAANFLRKRIIITPCTKGKRICNKTGFNIYLKRELYQVTDSIKARGVVYSLLQLTDEQKCKGVITISVGSFGFILCHYGDKFKIPVTVVMPTTATEEKVEICRQYTSSRVIVRGGNLLEAHSVALDIAISEGLFYLDGNDHPNMIIGQATLGIEIMRQSRIEVVLLPTTIEGCGLTTAIAIAIKGWDSNIKVIEVQSTGCNLFRGVKNRTDLPYELNIPRKEYIGCPLRNVPHCIIDRIISVAPEFIHSASIQLHESECYYDCHGAIALAAILSGQLDDLQGKRIGIPLYGRMDIGEEDFIVDRCSYRQYYLKLLVLPSSILLIES